MPPIAMPIQTRQLAKTISGYVSANSLVLTTQVASSILVTRWLDPSFLGCFNTVTVFAVYIQILLLGLNSGLNRELPYHMGQGESRSVQELINTGWWWTRLIGLIVTVVFLIMGIAALIRGDRHLGEAWLATAVVAPMGLLVQYLEVLFRAGGHFAELSKVRFINSVLGVVTTSLVLFFGWCGYLIRSIVLQLTYNVVIHRNRPIVPMPVFSLRLFWILVRTGLPIFCVGYLFSVFMVLDRTLIIRYLGVKEMGWYTPAIQVAAALTMVPSSICQVIYPQMCRVYGQTKSVRSLTKLAFLPPLIVACCLLPVYGVLWYAVEPVIRYVLPKYTEGIAPARWMIVTMYLHLFSTPQDVFSTINKLWPLAMSYCAGAIIMIVVSLILLNKSWGIEAVAAGQCAGMAVVVSFSAGFAGLYMYNDKAMQPAC